MTDRVVTAVLADDQSLIRSGIATLLTGDDDGTGQVIKVVGEAADGDAVLPLVRRTRPDVVLMDIRMPGLDGITATRRIRADPDCGTTPVIMLTTFDTEADIVGALRAGADGYLLKDAGPERLRAAVRAAAAGEAVLAPGVTRQVMRAAALAAPPPPDPRLKQLTARELEVLAAIAVGDDNVAVAQAMRLSPETIRTYVSRLLAKVGATSRAQLVAIAHRGGLLTPAATASAAGTASAAATASTASASAAAPAATSAAVAPTDKPEQRRQPSVG